MSRQNLRRILYLETQTTDVVPHALLKATWRRKPKAEGLIHSDQGSRFTSMDWAASLKADNLEHSMGPARQLLR